MASRTIAAGEGVVASRRQWPIALGLSIAMGIVGGLIALGAGSPFPALSPDSVAYLNAAANLEAGRGLTATLTPIEEMQVSIPFAAWPPIYPAVLTAASVIGGGLFASARLVQAISIFLLFPTVGFLTYRIAGVRMIPPVLAFLIVLRPQVIVGSFVWSEPLFIAFAYASFALLLEGLREERHDDHIRLPILFAGGVLAGLTMLTRYLGIVVIASGAMTLTFLAREESSGRDTLKRLAAFLLPASLPNAVWLIRNQLESGFWFGESRVRLPVDPNGIIHDGLRTLWMDTAMPPLLLDGPLRILVGGIGLIAFLVLFVAALRRFGPETFAGRPDRNRGANILSTFLFTYLIVVTGLAIVFHYDPINTRLFAPIYPALLVLAAFLLRPHFDRKSGASSRFRRSLILVAAGVLWMNHAAAAIRYASVPRETRLQSAPYWRSVAFADPRWRDDAAVQAIRELEPHRTLVLSNVADLVVLWTDSPAKALPAHNDRERREKILRHRGALVFIHPEYRRILAGRDDLDQLVREGRCVFLGRRGEGLYYRVLG